MKLAAKTAMFSALLILIALLNLIFHNQSARLEQQSTLLLSSAETLERDIKTLEAKAASYGANAPRDYQSYFRDVALYYKEFEAAVSSLQQDDLHLGERLADIDGGSLILQLSTKGLAQSHQQWQLALASFTRSYNEAIGDNKEEPRLEWATQKIREQGPGLTTLAQVLVEKAEQYNQERQVKQQQFALSLALAVIVASLIFSFWFFMAVVKPVKRLAETTNKVAEGNFGLQLEAKGKDEVSEVTTAFNSLSIRIDLILKLLDQLEEGASEQQTVDAVLDICGDYFNVDWVGIISLQEAELRLQAASPASSMKRWFAKTATIEDGNLAEFIARHIIAKRLWAEKDIDSFAVKIKDSRLMRELMRNTHAHSILGVPLGEPGQRRGMLLLASKQQGLLEGKRGELLMKLTPLISQRTLVNELERAV
ncbi:HAMP domain-containing protein [uncultured Pseudoteredinibacter sp.]|uniref:methyl-accepting chemotaxis protein n=1 Tax=uncultured Pseudoteredinibacter sp. TaxID=1641701 RepID=UPI0026245086|nr:HAMP domain-containing protein [uncultured Pseudoteredinibacter sp.]